MLTCVAVATDGELLAAWRTGDREAGRRLFAAHAPTITRFFRNKIDGDIDDLVQRVFLACVESRDRVREGSSFRAYLLRIARNELFDHYLARQRFAARFDPMLTSVIDLGASPSGVAAIAQRDTTITAALRRLPLELQTALELHYWEELSTAEMAEVLGIPQGTVKTRLLRARERLREAMRELGPDEPPDIA